MSYQIRSADGLASSNDHRLITAWNDTVAAQIREEKDATRALRKMNIRAAHPDDGWVDRARDAVRFVYPQFDDGVLPGHLIALGWPWKGYRIVRCREVAEVGIVSRAVEYRFVDEGRTWRP